MASEGKWETVPMKNKANRIENVKSKKNQTKSFIENMPRIEANKPITTSKTAYDAFIEKNRESEKTSHSSPKNSNHAENKKHREKKEKPKTFEETCAKLDEADIQSMINRSRSVKSTNPDAWVKEFTTVFNNYFRHLSQSSLTHTEKPKDFPLSALKKECRENVLNTLKQASSQTLEQIYFLVTQNMVNESNKGCVYGFQIILQLLAKNNPGIITARLNQYLEVVNGNKSKPRQSELALWSVCQCASLDTKVGIKAIVAVFVPAARVKSAAPYSIEFIEQFFRKLSNLSEGYDEISIKDYFQCIDLIFNKNTSIEPEYYKRLMVQLDKIKVLAYGSEPKTNLRNFFPQYLSRLDSFAPAAQQNEYLDSLVTCLSTDKQCFPAWCQLYTKNLPQSGLLLQYMYDKYNTVVRRISRKVLQQNVRSFSLTNEELSQGKSKNNKTGLERCTEVCKALQLKINQSGFPWRLFFYLFLIGVGCGVAYDIHTSPSLKASRTMVFLDDYGILAVVNQAWNRIKVFNSKVQNWLNVNAPVYKDSVVPYLNLAWTKTSQFFIQVTELCRPYVYLAWAKVGEGVQWFNTQYPNFWPQCNEYAVIAWTFIKHHTLCTWNCLVQYSLLSYAWLEKNVLVGQISPENIQRTALWVLHSMRNYTISAVSWCQQTIQTVTSS